jgi:hypothetical protein
MLTQMPTKNLGLSALLLMVLASLAAGCGNNNEYNSTQNSEGTYMGTERIETYTNRLESPAGNRDTISDTVPVPAEVPATMSPTYNAERMDNTIQNMETMPTNYMGQNST